VLGFVFQFHHLLPAFSALENVTLPALMREGRVTSAQQERARAMLAAVGLGNDMQKRPGELSGGMQQRVAIARALVLEPPLVLADEPTGNLDRASSDEVFVLMRRMHAELDTSFLIVTHDPRLAARCDRVIELVDGHIESDTQHRRDWLTRMCRRGGGAGRGHVPVSCVIVKRPQSAVRVD
jgi:lipoprotein-releasing system ATP-binding protein